MFKIISDSPYGSKRTPITGDQIRSTVRAVTIGKKKRGSPPKDRKKDKNEATTATSS